MYKTNDKDHKKHIVTYGIRRDDDGIRRDDDGIRRHKTNKILLKSKEAKCLGNADLL